MIPPDPFSHIVRVGSNFNLGFSHTGPPGSLAFVITKSYMKIRNVKIWDLQVHCQIERLRFAPTTTPSVSISFVAEKCLKALSFLEGALSFLKRLLEGMLAFLKSPFLIVRLL